MLVFLTREAYRRLRGNHALNVFQICSHRIIQVLRSTLIRQLESVMRRLPHGAFIFQGSNH